MSGHRIHLSQSIVGPLVNWSDSEWLDALKWITREGKQYACVEDLRRAFVDELRDGHEVVPIGDCDDFDWKKGCRGHAIPDVPTLKETP